jgi:hypothetical protein
VRGRSGETEGDNRQETDGANGRRGNAVKRSQADRQNGELPASDRRRRIDGSICQAFYPTSIPIDCARAAGR